MLHEKLVLQAPAALPSTSCGSQIGLHLREMQSWPATQVSAPALAVAVASLQAMPSGRLPLATQPMWPISSVVAVASISTIHVHFSPAWQPVWAIGLHVTKASTLASISVGLPPPPHAAIEPTNRAKARFFMRKLLRGTGRTSSNLPL